MNGLQFIYGGHSSQFESIVFIGFSFHIGPFPSIFIGGTNNRFVPGVLSEIADPARRSTGLHDDEIDFVFFEECSEELSLRGDIKEGVLSGFGVKEAAHGIEFSEIESENLH